MYSYRITKYDPKKRDENGFYTDSKEWTSFSAIPNDRTSYESYLKVENMYKNTIQLLLESYQINEMTIKELEVYSDPVPLSIKEGESFGGEHLTTIIELVLREQMWCKLEHQLLKIHFGYDYYMYVVMANNSRELLNEISEIGLFVEEYPSPYL
jgi:hypothetical protein